MPNDMGWQIQASKETVKRQKRGGAKKRLLGEGLSKWLEIDRVL
jgi:hypothetical protein